MSRLRQSRRVQRGSAAIETRYLRELGRRAGRPQPSSSSSSRSLRRASSISSRSSGDSSG
jgi:hypothetical protein